MGRPLPVRLPFRELANARFLENTSWIDADLVLAADPQPGESRTWKPPWHPELSGDYHVHSTFSDDAVSSLADIAAAARAGLSVIRLTDHVRVSTTWVPEFVSAVAAQPVPDGLTVLTGVEAKILDASGTLDAPATLAGVDAIVIADHQFPGSDGPLLPHLVRERLDNGLPVADALDSTLVGPSSVR